MAIPQDRLFRDIMTYYAIPSKVEASRPIYVTNNVTNTLCNHECSHSTKSKSYQSALVNIGTNVLSTAAASAIVDTVASRNNGRTVSYPTQFSEWNKGAHVKELDKITTFGPSANSYVQEVLDLHQEIVQGNCAKSDGLWRSACLFSAGMIGSGILKSRILQNNPVAVTATKIATAVSLTSSFLVFASSRMNFAKSAIPEHYSYGIRHYADSGVNPEQLPPPYQGYQPIVNA